MVVIRFVFGGFLGVVLGFGLTYFFGDFISGLPPLVTWLVIGLPGLLGGILFASWERETGEAVHGHPIRTALLWLIMVIAGLAALVIIGGQFL